MIGSSLRIPGLLALVLAVSGSLSACGGGSTTAAPSATPSGPASAASAAATPSTPVSPAGPATPAPLPSTTGSAVSPTGTAKGPAPASAAVRPVSAGDCPSLALVRTTLGLQVGAPAATAGAPDVVVCSYPKGANPAAVVVRIQEDQTVAGFVAARTGFAKSGQRTVDVPGMFDGAYRSQLGSTTYGVTRTLVVLRGSTEVLVTAQASFDGLTRLTHTMLD